MNVQRCTAALLLTLAVAASCAGYKGTAVCTEDCAQAGLTRCSGSLVQTCTQGAGGCLTWVNSADCAMTSQRCDPAAGACSSGCTDQCTTENASRCTGTAIETCRASVGGCLDWEVTSDCASTGQFCDPAQVVCSDTCVDQCPQQTATQCDGDVVQTCAIGAGGCLYWADGTDCNTLGQSCSASGGAASCVSTCGTPPSAPSSPSPTDGATGVDPAVTTSVSWAASAGALRYEAYLGSTCPPPAYPHAAFTQVATPQLTGLTLAAGTSYCWQVVALDAADCDRVGPVWSFQTTSTCSDPVAGPPSVTSNNASYGAGTTSGSYSLTFNEAVSNVAASLTWTPVVGTGTMSVNPISGQAYSIDFSGVADGDSYTLTVGSGVIDTCGAALSSPVAITITIDQPGVGGSCAGPADVSGATFPYTLAGTFDGDPSQGGSCETTPNNAVFFSVTPTASGFYAVSVQNQTTTFAYSRIAIFDGTSCSPYGSELACATADGKTVSTQVALTQGQSYLIMAYTDGDTYTMVDPIITITELTGSAGEFCTDPVNVSGVGFPHQLSGTFQDDPGQGGSCETTPNNAVWFNYTPTADGWYDLSLENHTSTFAYSRVAVFQGTSCSPYGAELTCDTSNGKTISTLARMLSGNDYLIMFYTDGDSYTMVDPEITIGKETTGLGELCGAPEDLSAATFPHQLSGTFHEDPAQGGSCDTTPTNAAFFSYTPTVTGSVTISAENFTSTFAYSRLAIFETASCSPYGTQVDCASASGKTVSTSVTLTAGTTYLIVFYTDGDSYTMVNPEITIN